MPVDDDRWLRFVSSRPDAHPFHHPAWISLIAETYGYSAFVVASDAPGGEIVAGLPVIETKVPLGGRRWVSLPFSDFCQPLAATVSEFSDGVDALRRDRGVRSLEIRASVGSQSSRVVDAGVIHQLGLEPDTDRVYARFKRSQVPRTIEKARREGVTVSQASTLEELSRVFYKLHVSTRRRLGVPVQPRRYFELFWQRIVEPGLGFVLVARSAESIPIAAAVFLAWNATVTYKYSASDQAALRLRPNNILLWEAIRWSCENGFRTFDFGRSDTSNTGLRAFKSGWGAVEEPLSYSVFGEGVSVSRGAMADRLLAPVIRRSPEVVCRALGSALYRYSA